MKEVELLHAMGEVLQEFMPYMRLLARGGLDAYFNAASRVEKEEALRLSNCPSVLPTRPNLLLHGLGKYVDREKMENLFTSRTVYAFQPFPTSVFNPILPPADICSMCLVQVKLAFC
jgi:hypothetical protein